MGRKIVVRDQEGSDLRDGKVMNMVSVHMSGLCYIPEILN